MKKISLILLCFISGMIGFSTSSYAVLPVIDTPEIAQLVKEFEQMEKQYALLQQSYNATEAQLNEVQQLRSDEEGHYGFGDLLNGGQDLKSREWSPNNWDDTLKGLSGGNPARYQELVGEYKRNHPTLSESEYEKGASKSRARNYEQQVQVNRAAAVNATYAFNDINKHLNTIHQLSAQIEKAKDEKAATDLNSRLVAEVAYIQTQELKMQVLLNQQLAQQSADNIESETEAAKFDQLPNE